MAFAKAILPDCPQCKQPGLRVIESRKSTLSTRRRKKCDYCGYKITTHEVTADFFEEAKQNQILVKQMRNLLGADLPIPGVEPPPSGVDFKALNKCSDCQHNKDGCYCAFEFPEYDTAESYDCNHFQLWKPK
jgi:hypothetical protein